jgi:hypothetical protein
MAILDIHPEFESKIPKVIPVGNAEVKLNLKRKTQKKKINPLGDLYNYTAT